MNDYILVFAFFMIARVMADFQATPMARKLDRSNDRTGLRRLSKSDSVSVQRNTR